MKMHSPPFRTKAPAWTTISIALLFASMFFWSSESLVHASQSAWAYSKAPKVLTVFEKEILSRASLIASARVEDVMRAAPGTEVVSLSLQKVYFGKTTDEKVVVLASRGMFYVGTEQIVFLNSYGDSGRFECFGRVSGEDVDYSAKLKVLATHVVLHDVRDDNVKAGKIVEAILNNLNSDNRWTSDHFARQLFDFVKCYPERVSQESREKLGTIQRRLPPGSAKTTLRRVLEFLNQRESKRGPK